MLILGWASLILCALSLCAAIAYLPLYYKSLKELKYVPVSAYLTIFRDVIVILLVSASFYCYAAWVAFRNRKHLHDGSVVAASEPKQK
jgi:hypothetical protein